MKLWSTKIIVVGFNNSGWSPFFEFFPQRFIFTEDWPYKLQFIDPYFIPILFDKFFETGQFEEKTNSAQWCEMTNSSPVWGLTGEILK